MSAQTQHVLGHSGAGMEEVEPGLGFLNPRFAEERFPWPQVWGYLGSLGLTVAALYLVIRHLMPPGALLATILVLAGGQACLQLGVFMHLRESRGPAWQVLPLFLSLGIAVALVGLSIWVMAFKWGVS